jgi:hypothetical protein
VTGYRSQPYDPHRHDADSFDSGEPTPDEWLRQHAAGADARRTARTFVWTARTPASLARLLRSARTVAASSSTARLRSLGGAGVRETAAGRQAAGA